MSPARGRLLLSATLFGASFYFLVVATGFRGLARTMPVLVGTMLVTFTLLDLVREVRPATARLSRRAPGLPGAGRGGRDEGTAPGSMRVSSDLQTAGASLPAVGWMALFAALVLALGVLGAALLFPPVFLRARGFPWRAAVVYGAVLAGSHWVLVATLETRTYAGLIARWL